MARYCDGGPKLTGVEVQLDPGDGGVRNRGNKFGEYPGLGAKVLRGSDGAWARQSAVSDAAPGSSAAEHGGGGVLGLVAARCWMGGAQGVVGV